MSGLLLSDLTTRIDNMPMQLSPNHEVMIESPEVSLRAVLAIPENARSIVLFAHGAGSSRHSPRNQYIAQKLQDAGFATLLMDLLTEDEERIDAYTARLRFDIPLLAGRLESATGWVLSQEQMKDFDIGYFGVDTGAAAALVAAIQRPEAIRAIVSRGGRPDLAFNVLPEVKPPVLFIVGAEGPDRSGDQQGSHQETDDGTQPRHRSRGLPSLRGAGQARYGGPTYPTVVRPVYEDARESPGSRR